MVMSWTWDTIPGSLVYFSAILDFKSVFLANSWWLVVHVGPKTFLSPKIPELATTRVVFPCQVTLDEIRHQRFQSQGFLVDYCPHYLSPPVRLTIAAALLVANEARRRGRYIRVFFLRHVEPWLVLVWTKEARKGCVSCSKEVKQALGSSCKELFLTPCRNSARQRMAFEAGLSWA